jgi:hypothetical protein
MKKLLLSLTIVISGLSASAQVMPLYLNLNSHNETDDPNDYSISATYTQVKQLVLEIADTVIANNARWNMQVESNFINACLTHENGFTNPNDLLDSLDDLSHIEVDPHNHFDPLPLSQTYNPYNYADLAHLLDSCGLAVPRKNMGGFLWQTATDWMPYQVGAQGNTYTNYTWQPNVVWGAGSPGHTNDYNVYGIWKPNGASAQFPIHNPMRQLTCIGNGCSNVISDSTPVSDNITQIVDLINYINTLPYDPNAYWTASIQFNFRDINMPGLADSISTIFHALQPYVNSGQIVWMTLTEKYDNWYNLHSNVNDYFQYRCDSLSLDANEISVLKGVLAYPNPVVDVLHLESTSPFETITVYDSFGRIIHRREGEGETETELDCASWSPGAYLVATSFKDGTNSVQRIIR